MNENISARIESYNKGDINVPAAIERVKKRDGPNLPFKVSLAAGTATKEEFSLSFEVMPDCSVSVHSPFWLGRGDQVETEDDCHLIDEACACIAYKLKLEKDRKE